MLASCDADASVTDSSKTESSSVSVSDSSSSDDTSSDKDSSSSDDSSSSVDSSADSSSKAKKKKRKKKKSSDSSSEADDDSSSKKSSDDSSKKEKSSDDSSSKKSYDDSSKTDKTKTKQQKKAYVWKYGDLSLTIPASWNGRYVIKDSTIYCKKCYDDKNGSGALFHIYTAKTPNLYTPYGYLLGISRDKTYYFSYVDQGANFDIDKPKLVKEHSAMSKDVGSILSSAKSPAGGKALNIGSYINNFDNPYLRGMWTDADPASKGAQLEPTLIFDASKNRVKFMGYAGLNDSMEGIFMYNSNAAKYKWNTSNWGDHGLVFINGGVYKVTCYLTAPKTLSFKHVMGKRTAALEGKTFGFEKDYEALYQYW